MTSVPVFTSVGIRVGEQILCIRCKSVVMVTIKKNQVISDVLFEGLESVMEDVFDSKDSLWVNAIQCITDILRELI